jgi:hypothetical protein
MRLTNFFDINPGCIAATFAFPGRPLTISDDHLLNLEFRIWNSKLYAPCASFCART